MENKEKNTTISQGEGIRKLDKEELEKVIGRGVEWPINPTKCGCAATSPSAQTSAIDG